MYIRDSFLVLTTFLTTLLPAYAQNPRFEDLPVLPKRPHSYFTLESRLISITSKENSPPISIHYKIEGKGKPILLLHGLMTDSYSYRYLIPLLARHYQVIVPDLPGAGLSQAPKDFDMSPENIALVISSFITALKLDRPYVVGNSLGGYETLWFASLHPEQLRRLVVIHCPGFTDVKAWALDLVADLPLGKLIFESWINQNAGDFVIKNTHYEDLTILSQEEVLKYSAIFKDSAQTAIFWNVLRQSMATAPMQRLQKRLPALEVPTLLLWARHDVLVSPSFGPRFQRLIKDSKLVWLDHTSHFTQVEAPEATAKEILDFDSD